MNPRHILRSALAGALLFFAAGGATAQRADPLAAIRTVERGMWQLRDSSGTISRMCVTKPAALIQIRHGKAQCEHFVMESVGNSATVRYSCAGHGNGRTLLTVETSKLLSLDTQGVADGSPFSEQYEGRLIGPC